MQPNLPSTCQTSSASNRRKQENKRQQLPIYSCAHPESTSPALTSDGLTCFSPLSSEDVLTLAMSNRATTCSLDLIPSFPLQIISHDILLFLITLINSSLTSGYIPAPFKMATVKQL